MKKTLLSALALGIAVGFSSQVVAVDPEQSRLDLIEYFKAKTPDRPFEDYKNGIYGYDEDRRSQWEMQEEFPPYSDFLDKGAALFEKDKSAYIGCLVNSKDGVDKIRSSYPYFNEKLQQVVTLEGDINRCRTEAGLKAFGWKKGDIAAVSSYLANEARGQKINVVIESEGAKKAFADGERLFVEPSGQLGLACASCHVYNASRKARSDILSPLLGHTTHFPVWRLKWAGAGTLHRRYEGCHKNMRSAPRKVQGEEYRNLEFFSAYMSNGLEINGPSVRQ
ncbi:sulfur oxidation c-type cytochrome SoxA [Thiomicrospira pelophila]|uniref:sulfur oxidation c-type cytochrome SoxA n=1 Tax=Thiomicrospira pelophila TaxID=934 RepID=UPI0004A77426|nr:sulfur oxidation c-type cytochrome SoxA [Thiomicrospira pelophila]